MVRTPATWSTKIDNLGAGLVGKIFERRGRVAGRQAELPFGGIGVGLGADDTAKRGKQGHLYRETSAKSGGRVYV